MITALATHKVPYQMCYSAILIELFTCIFTIDMFSLHKPFYVLFGKLKHKHFDFDNYGSTQIILHQMSRTSTTEIQTTRTVVEFSWKSHKIHSYTGNKGGKTLLLFLKCKNWYIPNYRIKKITYINYLSYEKKNKVLGFYQQCQHVSYVKYIQEYVDSKLHTLLCRIS